LNDEKEMQFEFHTVPGWFC